MGKNNQADMLFVVDFWFHTRVGTEFYCFVEGHFNSQNDI